MARVKFKNTKGLSKRLEKRFKDFTNSEAEMDKAAKTMQNELLSNLRSGIGGDDEILPDLKTSTIRRRGALATANRTASRYLQFFSNATFSGQLLRGLKVIAVKTPVLGLRRFEFIYQGTHRGYKNLNGTKQPDQDNGDIARGLMKRGWKLTGITASAQNRIKRQFIRFLRRK